MVVAVANNGGDNSLLSKLKGGNTVTAQHSVLNQCVGEDFTQQDLPCSF
jgi:hypothetical protein